MTQALATTATKSPLPWYGSDAAVAGDIASLLDGVSHVTIPFAGGLGILPHLSARGVLVNDLHHDATTSGGLDHQ